MSTDVTIWNVAASESWNEVSQDPRPSRSLFLTTVADLTPAQNVVAGSPDHPPVVGTRDDRP